MSNKTKVAKAVDNKTDLAETMSKVRAFMKVVTPEKAMRVFNRTKNDNVKLDKFLSNQFTLPKAFQPEHVQSEISRLLEPKNHEHFGLIEIEKQKALLNVICEELVGLEIASKTEWLQSFNLSEEQQQASARALTAYEATLKRAVQTVSAWKQAYGE